MKKRKKSIIGIDVSKKTFEYQLVKMRLNQKYRRLVFRTILKDMIN